MEGDIVLYNGLSTYFLKSNIGDENIVLTNNLTGGPTFIETDEDLDWVIKNGFNFTTRFLSERKPYTPYCDVCSGCGEEGCCSPMMCDMSPDGSYCNTYLRDLKYTYDTYHKVMDSIYDTLSIENKEKMDEIINNNIDKWY